MPILWRYLLSQFFRVFLLANFSFIAILMVSRLKQIAELAALGASSLDIFLFALLLIPYILPIAIPISCLLASVILFQRLSNAQELTAMRSGGIAIRQIMAPLLMAAAVITLVNFFVASELATHSHRLGKRLQAQVGVINPLLLLQNTKFLRMGEIYVDMTRKGNEQAKDLTCVVYNPGSERLNVISASELELVNEELRGRDTSVITSFPSEGFDHLVVENQREMITPVASFSHFIKEAQMRLKNDHLQLRLLHSRIKEWREQLAGGESPELRRLIALCRSEIVRRVSVALAAFSFTLMGCAFGMEIGRRPSRRGIILAILLSAFFLICFSIAGGIRGNAWVAGSLYVIPHLVIVGFCIHSLGRVTRGVA
jgi:lipopolysaccharide export system permease protein